MINMIVLYIIGTLSVIMLIVSYFYRVYENTRCKKEGIKQDKCSNFTKTFTETPKFYYLIEWSSVYAKTFPYYNRIIVDGDISEVRKRIKKLRKKYKDSFAYVVYEQRDLTNFIDWE